MKYTVKVKGYILIKYVDGQIHLQLMLYYQSIGKGQAKIVFFFRYSPIKVQILFFSLEWYTQLQVSETHHSGSFFFKVQ